MSQNCCGANKIFDLKTAQKEHKKYLKSGPARSTRRLIEAIGAEIPVGRSLLDIGGGIGALQWHFLSNGASWTTDVDYSKGYIQVARTHAAEQGWDGRTHFHEGDFLELSSMIGAHDFITLDKVICCYPDYRGLLTMALSKSKMGLGLVYPMGGWISRSVAYLGRVYLRLTGNAFRSYIHPVKEVRALVASHGFVKVTSHLSFPWHVELYLRPGVRDPA